MLRRQNRLKTCLFSIYNQNELDYAARCSHIVLFPRRFITAGSFSLAGLAVGFLGISMLIVPWVSSLWLLIVDLGMGGIMYGYLDAGMLFFMRRTVRLRLRYILRHDAALTEECLLLLFLA